MRIVVRVGSVVAAAFDQVADAVLTIDDMNWTARFVAAGVAAAAG